MCSSLRVTLNKNTARLGSAWLARRRVLAGRKLGRRCDASRKQHKTEEVHLPRQLHSSEIKTTPFALAPPTTTSKQKQKRVYIFWLT